MRNKAIMGKRDANQKEIVSVFNRFGLEVIDLANVGAGVPDLLVSSPVSRRNYLVEVKTKKGKLRKSQVEFEDRWHSTIYICRGVNDAAILANQWRSR